MFVWAKWFCACSSIVTLMLVAGVCHAQTKSVKPPAVHEGQMVDQSFDRPWKKEIAPILAEVTGLEVLPHGYDRGGQDKNPETICVIYSEEFEKRSDPMGTFPKSRLVKRASADLARLRSKLPDGYVAFIGTTVFADMIIPSLKQSGSTPASKSVQTKEDFFKTVFKIAMTPQEELQKSMKASIESMLSEKGLARVELAVGLGKSKFDIVRVAKTRGVNYGLTTEDVVKALREFDEEVGIEINSARGDSVSFTLLSTPDDKVAFSQKIVKLCPDTEETLDKKNFDLFVEGLEKGRSVSLWWD